MFILNCETRYILESSPCSSLSANRTRSARRFVYEIDRSLLEDIERIDAALTEYAQSILERGEAGAIFELPSPSNNGGFASLARNPGRVTSFAMIRALRNPRIPPPRRGYFAGAATIEPSGTACGRGRPAPTSRSRSRRLTSRSR